MFWKESRVVRVGVAATLTLAVGMVSASSAAAQEPPRRGVDVDVSVNGPGAPDVLAGLTVQVYVDDGGGTVGALVDPLDCDVTLEPATEYIAGEQRSCDLPTPGDYLIGLDGVPMGWVVEGSCTDGQQPTVLEEAVLDLGGAEAFTYSATAGNAQCNLFLRAGALLIDKVVVGGDASSADFTIEVLDGSDNVIASGADVADATCEADFDTAKCGVIAVPAGEGFFIGEASVPDYELTSVECDEFLNAEQPPDGGAVVADIGDDGFRTDDGDTYCVVTNTYVPPPTTTSTTTTTTIQPTTTVIDAGVVTLPETGASATANSWMALSAATLIGVGGLLLLVRRKES